MAADLDARAREVAERICKDVFESWGQSWEGDIEKEDRDGIVDDATRVLFDFARPLEEQVYVPNIWICGKCDLVMSVQAMDVSTGRVGTPAVQPVPECLNDGTSMHRQTWRENANGHADGAEALAIERNDYRDRLTAAERELRKTQEALRETARRGEHDNPCWCRVRRKDGPHESTICRKARSSLGLE